MDNRTDHRVRIVDGIPLAGSHARGSDNRTDHRVCMVDGIPSAGSHARVSAVVHTDPS